MARRFFSPSLFFSFSSFYFHAFSSREGGNLRMVQSIEDRFSSYEITPAKFSWVVVLSVLTFVFTMWYQSGNAKKENRIFNMAFNGSIIGLTETWMFYFGRMVIYVLLACSWILYFFHVDDHSSRYFSAVMILFMIDSILIHSWFGSFFFHSQTFILPLCIIVLCLLVTLPLCVLVALDHLWWPFSFLILIIGWNSYSIWLTDWYRKRILTASSDIGRETNRTTVKKYKRRQVTQRNKLAESEEEREKRTKKGKKEWGKEEMQEQEEKEESSSSEE